MNHGQPFTAIVFSAIQRGEEQFWAEVRMANDRPVFAVAACENCQGILCQVLDWSRRQGKELAWEYQLAKGTNMKKLISSGGDPELRTGAANTPVRTGAANTPGVIRSAVALTVDPQKKLEDLGLLTRQPLSATERAELQEREQMIQQGLETFTEVGRCLMDIRDRRLYREKFSRFEDYVDQRWGMSARHAHRLVDAAAVVQNLLPPATEGNARTDQLVTAPILPATESQARPLKGLQPQEQREVWQEAVKSVSPGDQVTAADVERAREKLHPSQKAATWAGDNPDVGREVELDMIRVCEGSRIDRTNCHDLLKATPKGREARLKCVFEFEGDLWVSSLGHMGGSPPDRWTASQECHRLIPDNSLYRGPEDGAFFAEGRIVFWQNLRFRLGPTVLFKGQGKRPSGFELDSAEYDEWGTRSERVVRTVKIAKGRVDYGGDIQAAYSGHKISEGQPIAKPFEFEGKSYCVTDGVHGPEEIVCHGHELIPEAQYQGPPRKQFNYQGQAVKWKGQSYRLGPKVAFRWRADDAEFDLQGEQALSPASPEAMLKLRLDQALKAVSAFLGEVKNAKRPKRELDCALSALGSLQYFQKFHLAPPKKKSAAKLQSAKCVGAVPIPKPSASSSPKAKADPFVLCRTDQSGRPTFRTNRGGWTTDPDKAVKFKNATLAAASSRHDWDKPMVLSKARRKVQFQAVKNPALSPESCPATL